MGNEYRKAYYQKAKPVLDERVECSICGATIKRHSLYRHPQSQRHKAAMRYAPPDVQMNYKKINPTNEDSI